MAYKIEVRIQESIPGSQYGKRWTWAAIRPTGGAPYVFDTIQEAQRVRAMCYPQQTSEEVRITKIK